MTSSGPSRPDRPAHRPPLSSADSTSNSDDNTSNTSQLSSSSTPAAASRIPSSGHVSSALAPAWPFNPSETALIRAGYTPSYTPTPTPAPAPAPASNNERQTRQRPRMAEPRARAPRQKGQMNFPTELRLLLLAYGDPSPHPSFPGEPLPETVRVLDEIVTDFILEMSHGAAQAASYAGRQKVKVDDFRFALRRDESKLGRVQELLRMERELKEARKAFDQNDDQVANLNLGLRKDAGSAKGVVGEEGEDGQAPTVGKKGKGKKRGAPSRKEEDVEEGASKKKKAAG